MNPHSLSLTRKFSFNKRNRLGICRSHILYFLNDVLIFKQKDPYDKRFSAGHQHRTAIYNDYLLNGNIYQTRKREGEEERLVHYPISKKILQQFEIPDNLTIFATVRPIENKAGQPTNYNTLR